MGCDKKTFNQKGLGIRERISYYRPPLPLQSSEVYCILALLTLSLYMMLTGIQSADKTTVTMETAK